MFEQISKVGEEFGIKLAVTIKKIEGKQANKQKN